ncbi:KilA-N domain-containing protein [Izhakiella capsodis]|uniref:KilA-N domain-containing protein n=1 Tax=Izhakiella capsodis TaxID=1367852 RepID=A0A1I4XVX2_9GAMM|nr:KilA-N domain-containing protein [Izhakiella capsodis]SFN30012.1 KilA-N domain-containing protein [Izhakiella capsodis]
MNTHLVISKISIHHDTEGRYSLNDLHKAAGNERRHAPHEWVRIDQTKETIEILNTENPVFNPIVSKKGRNGGTYVCKELVYVYAMWISPSFSLEVIRAYDALMSSRNDKKTTVDERTPLRDAINMLVSKKHLLYPEAYALIHQRFSVEHIDELSSEDLPIAIEYVHRLALEGELLPKQTGTLPALSIPVRGVIAMHFDGSEIVRTEFVPEGATVATLDQFASLVRHRGGIVLWDEMEQRAFVRERAMLRL